MLKKNGADQVMTSPPVRRKEYYDVAILLKI
jgi:hypothetical protein